MTVRCCAGILLVGLMMTAARAQAPRGAGWRAGQTQASAAALEKRIDAVDWDQVPFQEVVAWLREQGVTNVVARWRALETVGVDAGSTVTLSLRDSSLRQILTQVLAQLEDAADPLQFHALGNTLTISTRSDFNRQLYVRVYDVADLIRRVTNFTDPPTIDIGQSAGGPSGQGDNVFKGGTPGNDPGGAPPAAGGTEDDPDLLRLINVIKTSIEPDTWEIASDPAWGGAHGGGKGTIVPFNRLLVVRNTIEVHEKLASAF